MKYEGADRCRNIEIFIMYRTVKWATEGKTILRFDWC
jgi:hypothetical protein